MPTLRERIAAGGGSFMRALLVLHDDPTFENLMEAYTVADMTNRGLLVDALGQTHILDMYDIKVGAYTDRKLDLEEVHQMWLKMRWGGELIRPLESSFIKLAQLDDEVT